MKNQYAKGVTILPPCHEKLPKKMNVFLWLIAFAFLIELPTDAFAQNNSQTNSSELSQIRELHGRVTDEKGQPMDFATVQVFDKGVSRGGAKTDINGNYKIKPLSPGIYTVKVTYARYFPGIIEKVNFENEAKVFLDFKLKVKPPSNGKELKIQSSCIQIVDPSDINKKVMTESDLKHVTR